MNDFIVDLQRLLIVFLPFALGIVCHEVAHGYVAWRLGDPTARSQGRLTLNPIKHVDPMGLACFVITGLFSSFIFGWAKPVPVDPRYFKNPRQGLMLSSLAGPATNVLLALGFGLAFLAIYPSLELQASVGEKGFFLEPAARICLAGVSVNLVLAVLNMLPIPPLDGSKVLQMLMPKDLAIRYLGMEREGFILLIVLIAFGVLGNVLSFVVQPFMAALLQAAGA